MAEAPVHEKLKSRPRSCQAMPLLMRSPAAFLNDKERCR